MFVIFIYCLYSLRSETKHTYDHFGAMTVYVCNTTRITHWTWWDQYSDNRLLDLWPVRFDSAFNSLGQHPLYDMQNERSERIWYSVQSEKSVNYTYTCTYIRMSYYQRSIQNAIQKIKINEVLIIKSQRQSKCEETSLLGEIMRQTKSSQYACARELRVMN